MRVKFGPDGVKSLAMLRESSWDMAVLRLFQDPGNWLFPVVFVRVMRLNKHELEIFSVQIFHPWVH